MAAPFGGLASPAMAARTAAGLGARFGDKYGTSELGTVAASCGRGPGMHVFEDLFIVEALRKGRPAEVGQTGRLVVTDLVNTTMPLLRYDVGDVRRLHAGPCPCGRTTARPEVLGRVQEVLASLAGVLTPSEGADAFFADPAVANFRLEETVPASFEAAVVARPGGLRPILRRARSALPRCMGASASYGPVRHPSCGRNPTASSASCSPPPLPGT